MSFNTLRNPDALIVLTTAILAMPIAEVDTDIETYTERNLSYLRNIAITSHVGLFFFANHYSVGYRLQHMSNDVLYEQNPGLNLHMN
jgi:hypothetical protein